MKSINKFLIAAMTAIIFTGVSTFAVAQQTNQSDMDIKLITTGAEIVAQEISDTCHLLDGSISTVVMQQIADKRKEVGSGIYSFFIQAISSNFPLFGESGMTLTNASTGNTTILVIRNAGQTRTYKFDNATGKLATVDMKYKDGSNEHLVYHTGNVTSSDFTFNDGTHERHAFEYYPNNGNLKSDYQISADGSTELDQYDILGRIKTGSVKHPDGSTEFMTYDPVKKTVISIVRRDKNGNIQK